VAAGLDDGQIVFVVDTLNAGEVNEARAALPRLANLELRGFARDMITAHGGGRDRMLALSEGQHIPPEASDIAEQLQDESQSVVRQLLVTPATGIDETYAQSQEQAHSEALALLDQLVAEADSEPLRMDLADLRDDVQMHLTRVQGMAGAR